MDPIRNKIVGLNCHRHTWDAAKAILSGQGCVLFWRHCANQIGGVVGHALQSATRSPVADLWAARECPIHHPSCLAQTTRNTQVVIRNLPLALDKRDKAHANLANKSMSIEDRVASVNPYLPNFDLERPFDFKP